MPSVRHEGLAIGRAVLAAAAGLDEERQIFYADVTCQSVKVSKAVRQRVTSCADVAQLFD